MNSVDSGKQTHSTAVVSARRQNSST